MLQNRALRLGLLAFLLVPLILVAAETQGTATTSSPQINAQVPRTIRINGSLTDLGDSTVSSEEIIHFTLYQDQEGTTPLWSEMQQVVVGPAGRYTVLLGAGSEGGIPLPLFTSLGAHWLGVQLEGQQEQPPIMLVSVPYALKAADAETLGGLPASSFLRVDDVPAAKDKAGRQASTILNKALVPISGWCATNYIAKFTGAGTIGCSILYDTGNFVGLKTTTPRTDFDVNGTVAARRVTLMQDMTTSSPTWSVDNTSSRFRLFYQPYLNGPNGVEIVGATQTGVDVTGNLNVAGTLNVAQGGYIPTLSTNEITFPNPSPYPLSQYYRTESRGSSYTLWIHFPTNGVLVPYPVLSTTGGSVGIFTAQPRINLDVAGEIMATSRILLARDLTENSQAWNVVNVLGSFHLAHQDSLLPHGQMGTTVLTATESNRVGIGTENPAHTLDVNGDVAIVGAGHRLVFPDGTVQTSATTSSGDFFGVCISNAAGPQTCACPRLLSQTQVSAGQSCSTAGLQGNCTAVSQLGPPVTYGACCICN